MYINNYLLIPCCIYLNIPLIKDSLLFSVDLGLHQLIVDEQVSDHSRSTLLPVEGLLHHHSARDEHAEGAPLDRSVDHVPFTKPLCPLDFVRSLHLPLALSNPV